MRQIREMPLDTRNSLALVALVPGMRWVSTQSGGERATYVQGQGLRQNKTAFQLDGVSSNAPMDEGGTGIPNVDAVAEFNVETLNFSAENGRDPMQVIVATKVRQQRSSTAPRGSSIRTTPTTRATPLRCSAPRVRRNEFGGDIGGPVIRNKTFFFANFDGTVIHNAQIWNTQAVTPAMEKGDFSALSKTIIDPLYEYAIHGQHHSAVQIHCRVVVFPAQAAGGELAGRALQANTGTVNDTWEGTLRIDHQITATQRIYGRYVTVREPSTQLGYSPDAVTNDLVTQHNLGVNYTWTLSGNSVLTFVGGMLRTREEYTNDALGKTNDATSGGHPGLSDRRPREVDRASKPELRQRLSGHLLRRMGRSGRAVRRRL